MNISVLRRLAVAGAAGLVALVLSVSGGGITGGVPASEAGGAPAQAIIAIDTDITNGGGACATIDSSRDVTAGQNFSVAVCLVTNPNNVAVAGFGFNVLYDDSIITPNGAGSNTAPALDVNPDANEGATTYTSATYPITLGGGWDCTGGVGAGPNPNLNPSPGDGNGNAFSGGCGSAAGPNTLVTGPLMVIHFTATSGGSTVLDLDGVGVVDDTLSDVGTCDPSTGVPATCNNGTINVVGAPTNTPTGTPTATHTPCVDESGTPCPTNTSPSGGNRTATFTPTVTGSPTVPGDTPATGDTPAGAPTATPVGGGPGGVITGPDTGTGTDSDASARWAQLIGLAGVAAAAGGALLGRRRLRTIVDGRLARRR